MKKYRYQLYVMGMLVFQSNRMHGVKREARVWFKQLGVSYADIWSGEKHLVTRNSEDWRWHRVKGGCVA